MSHFIGHVVHLESPSWWATWLKHRLIKSLNINVAEAEKDLGEYPSFGAFFSRKLKAGARPIAKEGMASPCDGRLQSFETILSGKLIQSKGIDYSINDLFGSSVAEKYNGGLALTLYLAPHNYHRVHVPEDWLLMSSKKIAGDLWPVNRSSVESIHPLFCLNERWIFEAKVGLGCMALIMVGATNVGKMEAFHLSPAQNAHPLTHLQHDPPIAMKKGSELGVFHMGSTVILILDRSLAQDYKMEPKCRTINCGERLA